jgi:hypothetical protein
MKPLNKKDEHPEAYEVSPSWRCEEQEVVRYPNIISGSPWHSVSIFILSTFLDMHGERDILIRIVFTELKAREKQ